VIWKFFFLRELKKFPFFFALLFFSLFLGSLGLLGIGVVSEQVQNKLAASARDLLTSDFAISARRSFSEEEEKIIREAMEDESLRTYKIVDLYSMVTDLSAQESRLVEIRSTQNGFPFYGKMSFRTGAFEEGKLSVSKDLADLWGIKTGQMVQVGEKKFQVSGIVEKDSSLGLRGFSLAPRVYLALQDLETTGLLKPGVTGSFSEHFLLKEKTAEAIALLKKDLYKKLDDPALKITLPEESSEQSGRVMEIIKNFMALSALIGLVLSLVGVFYLYQSHLTARLKDLSLLNLYGLTVPKMNLMILLQFTTVFFLAIFGVVLFLIPAYKLLLPPLSESLGIDLSSNVSLSTVFKLVPFIWGFSITILIPLLMGLLRTPMSQQLKSSRISLGKFRFFDFVPFILFLWLFSWKLAQSFKIGSIFFLSLMVVFVLSTILIKILQRSIRAIIRGKGLRYPTLEFGLALRSLIRSGNKLTLSFLSLTLGATLISLILQLDGMIAKEFSWDETRPGLFIFDIQEDQMEDFEKYSRSSGTPLQGITPMIRGRLEKVNGVKFERQKSSYDMRSKDEDEDTRARNNGLNLTYRNYLSPAEKIVEGQPFPKTFDESRVPYVSLEKRWAERMKVSLGDKLTFDIQGVEFEGEVRNLREVKWTTFYPNFFVTIEPGPLDGAPKTFLSILPTTDKEKMLSFQRGSVQKFPNISFINVEEMVGKLAELFKKSRQAVEIISWLSLSVGLIILYGLSHDQVYRRYYDLALLKSLGFTSGSLRKNLLLEFGTLFSFALATGFFLGWLIAALIGKEVFKLPFSVDALRLFIPAAALTILCLLTILFSSWRAVRAQPRELLAE
jgi:putative ABC transport system permease protein